MKVWKAVDETSGGMPLVASTTTSAATSAQEGPQLSMVQQQRQADITAEMKRAVQGVGQTIDELAERQITDSVVALLAGYIQSIVLGLHKEGASSFAVPPKTAASGPDSAEAGTDCSLAVQTLSRQVPAMLKAHLISTLPKCSIVDGAVEEVRTC